MLTTEERMGKKRLCKHAPHEDVSCELVEAPKPAAASKLGP